MDNPVEDLIVTGLGNLLNPGDAAGLTAPCLAPINYSPSPGLAARS
jgi:hypothetical protein